MNYMLLSKTYNEFIGNMNRAIESGNREQAVEFARRAANVAGQIAFAPNIMPQIAEYYKNEIDKLGAIVKGEARRTPSAPQKDTAERKIEPASKTSEPEMTFEEAQAKLNSLIGLTAAKQQVKSLMSFVTIMNERKKANMKVPKMTHHMVFTGKPGTGKTTVARLIAQMFHSLGLLSKGQVVEAIRATLVAEYEGQTAIKTRNVINSALGGVLFIDEAYSLIREDIPDPFGKEAIDTLLTFLEDERGDLVVIAAGYPDEMEHFLAGNIGLSSRFKNFINFEDYTADELFEIFNLHCHGTQYRLSPATEPVLRELIGRIYENRGARFANGRQMRNLLEDMITRQCDRLAESGRRGSFLPEELGTLEPEDVPEDYSKYLN